MIPDCNIRYLFHIFNKENVLGLFDSDVVMELPDLTWEPINNATIHLISKDIDAIESLYIYIYIYCVPIA